MTLYILSLIGVAVFAISGALEAGRRGFDLMGLAVISLVTAVGGGTIRDVLLDRNPIFWIGDPNYLWAVLAAGAFSFLWFRTKPPPDKLLLVADALGLALFAISGTHVAVQSGVQPVIAVVMGAVTGAAGGVMRDILCRQVPLLFLASETLYATAAIAGSSAYLLLQVLGMEHTAAALIGMAIVAMLRLAAIFYSLRLPMVKVFGNQPEA